MAAVLHLLDQRRLIDSNGIADGGSIRFYLTGTTTPTPVYSTDSLDTPIAQPIVVGSGAAIPDIYLNDSITYRRIITYPDGSTDDMDPYASPVAGLATSVSLSASTGASLVGYTDGGTAKDVIDRNTFPTVAAMLASTQSAKGAGTVWRAGPHNYKEAASVATDHQLTTAGGVKLYLADLSYIDVAALGALPSAADNTAVIQQGFDLWITQLVALVPATLRIGESYTCTSGILVENNGIVYLGGALDMRGGRLVSGLTAAGVFFEFRNRGLVRNVYFDQFNVRGSANDTETVLWDCGSSSVTPKQFVYGCVWDHPIVENAPVEAWHMLGNLFEVSIRAPNMVCTSRTAGTYAMHFEEGVSGSPPSSIDIYGGATRGGINGLFAEDIGDVKIYGGTFIESGEHALNLQNLTGGGVIGAHVENAWMDGAGTNKAGVRATGSGFVTGVHGTANHATTTSVMDHVVEVFSAGDGLEVSSCRGGGDCTEILYVATGSAGANITGTPRSKITFANLAAQRATSVDGCGRTARNATATGAIAINRETEAIVDLFLTGNVTIGAPTNGAVGDKLIVAVQQDTTGGRTVTWNSAFRVATAVDATANLRTTWQFFYTGGVWIEQSAKAGVPS